MAIPIATTTIDVLRSVADAIGQTDIDPYDTPISTPVPNAVTVVSGVRAHISAPTGTEQEQGGQRMLIRYRLDCDPCDLKHTDQIRDAEGNVYDVLWVMPRNALGIDHIEGELLAIRGRV